jgi:hypothetical protein
MTVRKDKLDAAWRRWRLATFKRRDTFDVTGGRSKRRR